MLLCLGRPDSTRNFLSYFRRGDRVSMPSSLEQQLAIVYAELEATRDRSSRAAAAFEEQREFLEKAQEVARIGSWAAELDGSDRLSWSKEMFRIFGEPPSDQPTTRTLAMGRYVHPDDREALRIARETAVIS